MIHRSEHKAQYAIIENALLRDRGLSLSARGLLAFMLTYSEEWNWNFEALAEQAGATKYEIRQTLKELQAAGYVRINQTKTKGGKFAACSYEVFEKPRAELPHAEKPHTENRLTKNRLTEFEPLRIPKEEYQKKNTKSKNNKLTDCNIERRPFGFNKNVFLNAEEVQELKKKLGPLNAGRYIDLLGFYIKEHPGVYYKSHYEAIVRWYERDQEQNNKITNSN